MDHRALIRSLTAQQKQSLTTRSDAIGLAHLAGHFGAILLVGGLIVARVPYWPLLLPVQGVLVIFLFTLLHETSHRTVFATSGLNTFVGDICGLLILIPPRWFRDFHFAHHRYTQDPARDPELAEPKPETWRQYAVHLSGLPTWWSGVRTLLRNAFGRCSDDFVPQARRGAVAREARVMLAVYLLLAVASLTTGSAILVWVWFMPALLGQPVLRRYLLAEHGRCPEVENMFENTRTTFTTRLMLKLAWNMPYHAEHHAYPGVPFHRLPAFHRLTAAHLKVTEEGYGRFHQKYVAMLAT